jgi:periplasmic copper chaperone A
MEHSRGVRRTLGGVALVVLLIGATAATCSSAATTPLPGIVVTDAWARPAAAGGDSAAYLTITNPGGADVLLSVHCTIASSTMLHQTSTDTAGMTGMAMLGDLPVPAGSTIRLQPGGTHLMLGGITRALAVGENVELRLQFQHGGEVVVPAVVRPG